MIETLLAMDGFALLVLEIVVGGLIAGGLIGAFAQSHDQSNAPHWKPVQSSVCVGLWRAGPALGA